MKILATFPGKFGDLLWALPAIKALAYRISEPIDLVIAHEYRSIVPLIQAQDYIGACRAEPWWVTQDTAPISPRVPPTIYDGYDAIYHLGYRGWPQRPLPYETLDCLNAESMHAGTEGGDIPDGELHLDRPWITLPTPHPVTSDYSLTVGFTDEHFELKYGLTELIRKQWGYPLQIVGRNPRWVAEAHVAGWSWIDTVRLMQLSTVFLGCCSALHVLAVAMGIPAVIMEPNPMRHHPIFYPLGDAGPQVTLVKGNDGLPTFDARHVYDTLHLRLEQTR